MGTMNQFLRPMLAGIVACLLAGAALAQQPDPNKPEFPPFEEVTKGYEKVVSTADGQQSLYTLYVRAKDGQMLAELPKAFESQKHFVALTVSSGERYAGLQAGDMYVYWRRYDKQLALIEPNIETRSTGDRESKDSVQRLFTDRVILSVPILTQRPGGGLIIDMDQLLVGQASKFFGPRAQSSNSALTTVKKAKAFPENVEIAFEFPGMDGRLRSLHYSISVIPPNNGYKTRVADERVGFFTTSYTDLGKFKEEEKQVRFINRWRLEKADPSLKLSPPKEPIVFYLEHTTPVRYRRWVRQGVLHWNKAFEKIGFSDAIEVRYQDAGSNTHMDKDPEDVRYNFIRWLNNDMGTAIGPSRVNPETGQILDADIILTDGWIRHYWEQFHEVFPKVAMEGFSAETLAWLAEHPSWDPRVVLAPPAQREYVKAELARRGAQPFGGHAMTNADPTFIGDDEFDGLVGRTSQINGMCLCAQGKGFDLALLRMHLAVAGALADEPKKEEKKEEGKEEKKEEKKEEPKKEENLLDGIPEEFVGPLVAELVAHEVGHTLGLRHNFKASSIYTLEEINSEKVKGVKPFAGSVMDYLPVNMFIDDKKRGDTTMLTIGPYDLWAIEYGYTLSEDLKPILARVAEPELAYATDEDTSGPDPLARRYDFAKNPNAYAKNQMELAKFHRGRIIDKFVKDGDTWAKARKGYEMTLFLQTNSLSMMANWLGGTFIHRDKKGDKNARLPIEVVPAKDQREALQFVIANAFADDSFGLTSDLLSRMSSERWLGGSGFHSMFADEPAWPVHDRIMGIQASTLTMLMNPTTLRQVYDNEFRVPADQDALTLPELLETVTAAIWTELEQRPQAPHTARKPLISSLRRNLQREHLDRLIDLTLPGAGSTAAYKPISNLTRMQLSLLESKIISSLGATQGKVDPYTIAHLTEAKERIKKALDAQYIYNANKLGGSSAGSIIIRLGEEKKE